MQRSPIALVLLLALAPLASRADMRVYDVDASYRQEVFQILNKLLRAQADPNAYPQLYGRVEMLPSGQIVVDASPQRHAEIAALLQAIDREGVAEAPTVTLVYWALVGVPGTEDGGNVPPVLEPVTRQLEARHGPLGFSVADAASIVSTSGQQAHIENGDWEVNQTVYPNQGRLNAEISIDRESQELHVVVPIEQGQYVVLGETTTDVDDLNRGVIAFVVHWPEDD